MKANKHNKGIVVTFSGEKIEFKSPKPLTLNWLKKYAYHYAGVKREEVAEVLPL